MAATAVYLFFTLVPAGGTALFCELGYRRRNKRAVNEMDPAKRGDLVVYETRTRDYVIGEGSSERTSFRAAKVVGVKRDGTVAKIVQNGGAPLEVGPGRHGWHRCWVVSSDVVDVDAAVMACDANPWPHDSRYIHCPFDSLEAITALIKRYRLAA